MIRRPRYVIAVHDLERSARYYRDVLGFEVRDIGDPGWRLFVKDQCLIMAGECRGTLSPQEWAIILISPIWKWMTSIGSMRP
jgi:catechol-2,3-dioxygenase